jgi:3-hydroxybutyryl-CoA dehydratase
MAIFNLAPARPGYAIDELSVGMSAVLSRRLGDSEVVKFAKISGDDNPVHLDEKYARNSAFGGRIVHGALLGGLISAVIGSKLPGPGTVYIKQSLTFCAPVRLGELVEAKIAVTQIIREKNWVMLTTTCRVGDRVVIDGDALVMPPKRPA